MVSGPYVTFSRLVIICTFLPFRCLLSDMYGNLFNMVILLSLLISRMLIYIILSLSIIIISTICLAKYALRVFATLTKTILSLYQCKGFCIAIYLDDILVLVCSKVAGKRAQLFLFSLLVCLGLLINFSKIDLCLTQTFCFFGGYVGIL